MSNTIVDYYNELGLNPVLVDQNLEKFDRNPDIMREFEYWIETKQYIKEDCVEIDGYTAEGLSKLSRYLVGDSSFLLLIELREEPEKANKRISKGFKAK